MSEVIMYTTPSCGYCKLAKAFFQKNKVEYKEFDVMADPRARDEMIGKSGQFGVPVIDIDGQIIVGFDKDGITEALGLEA